MKEKGRTIAYLLKRSLYKIHVLRSGSEKWLLWSVVLTTTSGRIGGYFGGSENIIYPIVTREIHNFTYPVYEIYVLVVHFVALSIDMTHLHQDLGTSPSYVDMK